jgi:phosphatidylinositol glycan class O
MENSNFGLKLWLVLIIQTALYFFGIYIFTQGFLLNRIVVPKNSTCNDSIAKSTIFQTRGVGDLNIESCWRPARFKKAILVVIDALRYDFMVYNESLEATNALSFQNKLGVIHEVLKTKPDHGGIFQFVADPPTTTMQRIKGLTTGKFKFF